MTVWSLLSWERGLKFLMAYHWAFRCVAPLVGAWIEMLLASVFTNEKITVAPLVGAWIEISCRNPLFEKQIVAPLVGAWIEIFIKSLFFTWWKSLLSWERGLKYVIMFIVLLSFCRSSRGSVDWNNFTLPLFYFLIRRSSRGSVDWNRVVILLFLRHLCRSSRGSVDWNSYMHSGLMLLHVAPLVGAWIEIIFINKNFFTIGSLLSWERGLKLIQI